MVDSLSPAERSKRMALVRSEGTKPEMIVRRLVHSLRYRYRLHDRALPGRPDLVFRSRRKVIFVHGCFWHRHGEGCALTRMPKSLVTPWSPVEMANSIPEANPAPGDSWYRMQAMEVFHKEGFLEIDEDAPISQASGNPDKGAYVQAWLWIPDPEDDDEISHSEK